MNGVSVTQAETVGTGRVSPPSNRRAHGVILAEGAAAKTYIDDDNRGLFHKTVVDLSQNRCLRSRAWNAKFHQPFQRGVV